MDEDMIHYSQAISLCAAFAELNQVRAESEEIVDCMFQRFHGMVKRSSLTETIKHVLNYAINIGLIEQKEENLFSPTQVGMLLGKDWLKQLQQNN